MGQGLAASIVCIYVCMYVCHVFGMQLILVKIIHLSGKDRLGFRNACHVALAIVSNPDPSLFHSDGCTASSARGGKGLATLARFSCSLEEFA